MKSPKTLSAFANVNLLAALFLPLLSPTVRAAPEPASLHLVFSDEFDTDGLPAPDIWSFENGFVRNEELQWYQPDNAYQKGGYLVIEGRQQRVSNPRHEPDSTDWRRSRSHADYTSASLNTSQSFSFTYGRLEVRARIPAHKGAWPAIWLLGSGKPWPDAGEVDLMEFYQIEGEPHILANAAWGSETPFTPIWDDAKIPLSHFTRNDPNWAEHFHTWTMDWDEKSITLSLDSEVLNVINLADTKNPDGSNPFREPMYVLLNLAIGSNGGDPTQTGWPQHYEIDYVRVYQFADSEPVR